MINRHRGEVEIVVDGQSKVMRLPLGAIAALEDAMGAKSMVDLVASFETGAFRTQHLLLLLWAGLNGGGWTISTDEVEALSFDGGPVAAAKSAAELLTVTFGAFES